MRVMAKAGFSPTEARDALLPLMRGAVDNLADGSPSDVITGPISRGDVATVTAHLVRLDAHQPEAALVYRALGREALALASTALEPDVAEALARVLT
jgi:predicted short-subunit dehydrogenase-like oxidoreductase (DUF2520 family)